MQSLRREGRAWQRTRARDETYQLGITQATVKTAITLGTLKVVRIHALLNMVTAAAIEEYRRAHLGRQGRPRGARNESTSAADETGAGETEAG